MRAHAGGLATASSCRLPVDAASAIVLGDRFFCSFLGIAGLSRRGVDVLFRMHQRRKYDFRKGRCLGVEDHVVTWTKPERPEWMDEET